MLPVDHVFLFAIFVLQPVVSAFEHRSYRTRIAAGQDPDRRAIYTQVMAMEWTALAVVMGAWLWLGRPFGLLGFSPPRPLPRVPRRLLPITEA